MTLRVAVGLTASLVNLLAMGTLGRRGKQRRVVGWCVYIGSQMLWLTYAIVGHLWEMMLLNFGAIAIAVDNLWNLERRIKNAIQK